jgi:hypothetical protein
VREIVNKSEDYYSFKDPQTLHLNYGQVGVLNYTKNETKFRQYRCNWVHKRKFVTGIKELGAITKGKQTWKIKHI